MADRDASDDVREPHLRASGDFLGAFAVIQRDDGCILFVQNERSIGGKSCRVWDLPGGQVEPGELLHETLARELCEELSIQVAERSLELLFLQDGERVSAAGRRDYAWRSFFFAVRAFDGTPQAGAEVLACRWIPEHRLAAELTAPYHDCFLQWIQSGRSAVYFRSAWRG